MKRTVTENARVNNPVRTGLPWRSEAAVWLRITESDSNGRVREIDCGRGVGTAVSQQRFGARKVHASDIGLASRELLRNSPHGFPHPARIRSALHGGQAERRGPERRAETEVARAAKEDI